MFGLSFIKDAIGSVTGLIDSITTTDEEKMELSNSLIKIEHQFTAKILEYESKLMTAQQNIIVAEAQGQSRLQRVWRPITMLTFLTLIVCHYLGLLAFPIADQMWTLLQIGIGGYIGGRSIEKIAPKIVELV